MPIYEYECKACGRRASLLFASLSKVEQKPRCPHCNSLRLSRLVSKPALIRVKRSGSEASGSLRAVEPRKALEHVARSYDDAGIDPGRGFEEVARRVQAGDSAEDLKQAVVEARRKEGLPPPKPGPRKSKTKKVQR